MLFFALTDDFLHDFQGFLTSVQNRHTHKHYGVAMFFDIKNILHFGIF